jgi:hypothetical protein
MDERFARELPAHCSQVMKPWSVPDVSLKAVGMKLSVEQDRQAA